MDDAAGWYDERRAGLGASFVDAIDSAISLIARWPSSGAPVGGLPVGLNVRRAPIARFPYHIAYLVADDQARILAVAHDRRRPNYWASRATQ